MSYSSTSAFLPVTRIFSALSTIDKIAGVDVRGVGRLVLALQDHGDLRRQAAEHLVGGIDDVPVGFNFARLGLIRAHDQFLQIPSEKSANFCCQPPRKNTASNVDNDGVDNAGAGSTSAANRAV